MIYLVVRIGWPALVGIGIGMPIFVVAGKQYKAVSGANEAMMKRKDARVAVAGEALENAKIVKTQSFVSAFEQLVDGLRRDEVRGIRDMQMRKVWATFLFAIMPTVQAIVTILLAEKFGDGLSIGRALEAVSMFEQMRMPLQFLP